MTDELKQLDPRDKLRAYADGELDAGDQVEVTRRLGEDAAVAGAVLHEQQLRQAVGRAMRDAGGTMPENLRKRIEQMAADAPEPATESTTEPIGRIDHRGLWMNRWLPAAAAAVLLLASIITLNIATDQRDSWMPQSASVMPVQQVDRFAKRHVGCTTMVEQLVKSDWPKNVQELPGALSDYLGHQPGPTLDLTRLGYEFGGVGPCKIPGDNSVHLIYHHVGQRRDSLSLWLRPDDGRFDMAENKPFRVNDDDAPHPMVVWRHDGLLYLLMGDSPSGVERTSQYLARGQ